MVALFSKIYAKIWVGFCLNTGKRFFLKVFLKVNRKSIGSYKKGTKYFQNSPPLERFACFYVTISGNFERSQYFNFETDFLENENLFQKKLEYRFLVESTKIESV